MLKSNLTERRVVVRSVDASSKVRMSIDEIMSQVRGRIYILPSFGPSLNVVHP